MKKHLRLALGFVFIVPLAPLLSGCGSAPVQVVQPPDTRDQDELAIQAISKDWTDAQRAKDLPKCVSFYADDAELFRPGSFLVTGKEGLRREWEKILAQPGTPTWMASRIEVARSSDLAYETGVTEAKTVDKDKKPDSATGKYLRVWRKEDDGKWKVIEDIDNSNQ